MCWVNKCCFVVPLDLACLLLGSITLLLSLLGGAYALELLICEIKWPNYGVEQLKTIHLVLNSSSVKILVSLVIMVEVLWMLFSIMLIVGIKKNKPSFVVSYFSFGIVVSILMILSSLLLLLNGNWLDALILGVSTMLFIHCLVVVHTVYDLMQRGKFFRLNQPSESDEDQLIESSG